MVTFFVSLQSRTSACDLRSSGRGRAPPDRMARAVGTQRLALDEELAGLRPIEPVDQSQELRPTGPDEPTQADDLARVNLQAHAADSG